MWGLNNYLFFKGLLISLDVWLGHWSKMCTEGNCGHNDVNCSQNISSDYKNYSVVDSEFNQTFLEEYLVIRVDCGEEKLQV